MPFTRRQFLGRSLGTLGALAAAGGEWGCTPPFLEGIYTDRFTYRQRDTVTVYAALLVRQTVNIDLLRLDGNETVRVARFEVAVDNSRTADVANPGVTGAAFRSVLEIPLSDMPPGVYSVALPQELMYVDNWVNDWNTFTSRNDLALFVVTADQPGSHSRILCVHDSLTGVAYGGFGYASIYGTAQQFGVPTVSFARPGLDRATVENLTALRQMIQSGYEFEYIDLVELNQVDPSYLDAYDLAVVIGQFEYIPHGVMSNLAAFLDAGGNLICAGSEFAIFRVRLDMEAKQLTTYKDSFESTDPLWGTGSPLVAGVGQKIPETVWESDITGQTLWAGYYLTGGMADLKVHHTDEVGWILEGTGWGEGDLIPAAAEVFGSGNLIEFDDAGAPFVVGQEHTRSPADTIVWGTVPCSDAHQWWAPGLIDDWPRFNGYATATYQRRPSGAQVVNLPGRMVQILLYDPTYAKVLSNLMARLSTRG